MIQTTRDFRSDLGGGGGQFSGAMRMRTGGPGFIRKNSSVFKNKRPTFLWSKSYKTTYGHPCQTSEIMKGLRKKRPRC